MIATELKRLNKRLADSLGCSPVQYGSVPLYKWMWSPELTYDADVADDRQTRQTESGLWVVTLEKQYEPQRQLDKDVWMIAAWAEPPDPAMWRSQIGNELRWPSNGWYTLSDVFLNDREEPNDDLTQFVIQSTKWKRSRNYNDFKNLGADKLAKADKKRQDLANDLVDEYTFESIPGLKGGPKSFGGIA